MPGLWGWCFFFVWGEFFVPSYSTFVFALVNRGENIIMSSDAVGIKSIYFCALRRMSRGPGAVWLSASNRHCTAVHVCWSVAYLLPIASLMWKGFLANQFFSSSKASVCNFVFFEQKRAVYCWSESANCTLIPFPLHMFLLRGQTSLGQLGG